MASPPLPPPIAHALGRGAIVLTPSQRAARTLRQAFDAAASAGGRSLWTPPEIFALDTWLAGLWHQALLDGSERRVLLNRAQEHLLWREAITADPETPGLRSPDALAAEAARALRLLHLHGGRGRLPAFASSADTRALLRWTRELERHCRTGELLTPAELPAALAAACDQGRLPLPAAGLLLVDFDQLPPAPELLFKAIRRAGLPVEHLHSAAPATAVFQHVAADDDAELRTAARWAKRHLDGNPQARVAVVVPNLADRRAAIDRTFAAYLAPGEAHIASSPAALPYEFSLGRPLLETELASTALTLLRWTMEPLTLNAIRPLLLSPFFGAASGATSAEALATAAFDAFTLPRVALLRPELTLADFTAIVRRSRDDVPALHARLETTLRVAREERFLPVDAGPHPLAHHSFGGWAESFRKVLGAAGWTRPATADSLTFQTHRSWESALDQLATLDAVGVDVPDAEPTLAEALEVLTRLLEQTIFAPGSREAPVQILGPLEVGGVPFDALWFLGADDLAWPPPAQPQPLLPFALARLLGLPGTSPAEDRAAAAALTRRLAHASAETVFSYAQTAEDGDRRPSPLVQELNPGSLPDQPPEPAHEPRARLLVPDNTALPPLAGHVRGGARVLELQAACPFRAVAELRLHASEPGSRRLGFDAMESGSIIHVVMDDLWQELGDQAGLRALPPSGRAEQLRHSIAFALAESNRHATGSWDEAYLQVQAQRLQTLLEPWLERELARAPFTVMALEEERPWIPVGPLELRLRIDRIDQTDEGIVLIDYKTGLAEPRHWLGERPDAPQLPLYAVLPEAERLAGIAFAQLRAGKGMDLKGFADDATLLGRKPTQRGTPMEADTFAGQVERWREVVTGLATEFAHGEAAVHPKSYPQTCKHCGLRSLCRLNPVLLDEWCDDTEPETEPLEIGGTLG